VPPVRKCWRIFGLEVDSDLPLPGPTVEPSAPADVTVRFGEVAPQGQRLAVLPQGDLQIEVADVGRYQVRSGREILVDAASGTSDRNLRVFLLGSAMGALLHQRGLLPLHANSVVIDGRAVAFMGPSGSGKSTLAAWFQHQGFPLLADDVLAVSAELPPIAFPGVARLRLWEDALDMLNPPGGPFERSFDGQPKFDVPIRRTAGPTQLHACYVLDDHSASAPKIHRLGRMDAMEALMANTYRGAFLKLLGRTVAHARQCIRLTNAVAVYRVSRSKERDQFEEVASLILEHAARSILQAPVPETA